LFRRKSKKVTFDVHANNDGERQSPPNSVTAGTSSPSCHGTLNTNTAVRRRLDRGRFRKSIRKLRKGLHFKSSSKGAIKVDDANHASLALASARRSTEANNIRDYIPRSRAANRKKESPNAHANLAHSSKNDTLFSNMLQTNIVCNDTLDNNVSALSHYSSSTDGYSSRDPSGDESYLKGKGTSNSSTYGPSGECSDLLIGETLPSYNSTSASAGDESYLGTLLSRFTLGDLLKATAIDQDTVGCR